MLLPGKKDSQRSLFFPLEDSPDLGDAINVLLMAAAFNFKRMMNKYKERFAHFFLQIRAIFFY
jgi:hypothetical protein